MTSRAVTSCHTAVAGWTQEFIGSTRGAAYAARNGAKLGYGEWSWLAGRLGCMLQTTQQ